MNTPARWRAYICCGPDCTARRSPALLDALEREVAAAGLACDVEVLPSGCMKHCERGPSMVIQPGTVYYEQIDPARLRRIVRQHLRDGRPLPEWFYREPVAVPGRRPAPAPVPGRPVPLPAGPPRRIPGPQPSTPPRRRPAPDVDDFKW